MSEGIVSIYDKIFKRILTLSNVAVINFINGLFDKNFPIDSEIIYNWTESITDELEKTIADTILTINNTEKFHMEVQISNDESMVLRVFDYSYQEAIKYKKISDGRIRLKFPESKIIFLEHNSKTPDEVILEMDFLEQGKIEYKIPTMKFLSYSAEELNNKHMVILLPLYLLKLRREIAKNTSKENAKALKKLIEIDIIKTIEENKNKGYISYEDSKVLINLLKILYENLYGDIKELKEEGVDKMISDRLILYTEEAEIRAKDEKTVEIALNMVKIGIEVEKIAQATGLSLERVIELKESQLTA